MMLQTSGTSPLFSNDWGGFFKVVSIIAMTVTVPIFGFVLYWLRRGPDDRINVLERDARHLITRVDEVEKENERQGQRQSDFEARMVRSEVDRTDLREKTARVEVRQDSLEKLIQGHNSELTQLIISSSKEQTEATHKLELQFARLAERADLAKSLDGLARSVAEAIRGRQKDEDGSRS